MVKPQWMGMSWALWPGGIDEFIVDVLLGRIDDPFNVAINIHVTETLAKPRRVIDGQGVVSPPDGFVEVTNQ